MITILYGTDRLTIDERVESLRREIDPSGISTTIIDDASSAVASVRAAAGAVGFFGSGRLVIARDLLSGAVGRGRRSKKSDDTEQAIPMLADIPNETTLLIVERSLEAAIEREARRVVPTLNVERCDVPRGQRLVEWTCARARRHAAVIGQSEARALLEALFPGSWPSAAARDDVPPDLVRLDTELAKLATAAGTEGTIEIGQITALVAGAEALDFWGITNAIMAGDERRAVIEIERSYGQGSAAEVILGQVVGQFEALAVAASAGRNADLAEAARISGLSEGRLRQALRYQSAFPPERVAAALDELRNLDAATKQGTVDLAAAMVPLIVRLAGVRVTRTGVI